MFKLKYQGVIRPLLALTAGMAMAAGALAQNVLKIGEINSYKAQPAFLEPYKKGMQLAVDEANAAGGVLGRKIELITRDDNANPGDAVRAAEVLMSREQVDVLMGSFLSHIGLALTDFATQKKVFFLESFKIDQASVLHYFLFIVSGTTVP